MDLSPFAEAGVVGVCLAALTLCGYLAKLLADVSKITSSALVKSAETQSQLGQWLRETMPLMLQARDTDK
jgi:hypothetical protein